MSDRNKFLMGVTLFWMTFFTATAVVKLEGVVDITRHYWNNGEVSLEEPRDVFGRLHGQRIHYWDDGRMSLIQSFWHGYPADQIVYMDTVVPDIYRISQRYYWARVGLTGEKVPTLEEMIDSGRFNESVEKPNGEQK